MKIVLINGGGGVGKDTFVQICQRMVGESKILNISTIDIIKEAAVTLGWDGNKDERGRKFLSDLKDLATNYSDLSTKYIKETISKAKNKGAEAIFVHCREPEELGRLQDIFNATTLLIKNKRVKPIESNHADRNVENFFYDYTIDNNDGILELTKKAADFLHEVGVLS